MLQQSKRKVNGAVSSRVKVAVRCRPAFQDEIDFAKGDFFSIVETKAEDPNKNVLGRIGLTMISGKQRDFYFDYIFGDDCGQDHVYDRLARPVVADVLKGCNGTIFAYGQTGTGKTYTMGILEFVSNEHAGLIPRSIAQIFSHIDENDEIADVTVSLSFLQLYRETIQDLLVQINNNGNQDDNLVIREDPVKGFYVAGLQEFVVRSYLEAEALINLGLENRAIAPTLMNATSSRSHTVLTIHIEQRVGGNDRNNSFSRTLRSKLLMVDLAGSERVRRTVSKGTRLSEAKSINTSLSALGNVIAALADSNTGHIPYRDSKLTRLLQDSLGGTASTALIATIGPAAVNYGETLSTLLFAQRCMAVKVTPLQHEEVDYAEMAAKLQAQVNELQSKLSERLDEQQSQYEQTIHDLRQQLEDERAKVQQVEFSQALRSSTTGDNDFHQELSLVLESIDRLQDGDTRALAAVEQSWFRKPTEWAAKPDDRFKLPSGPVVSVLAYSFELVQYLSNQVQQLLEENQLREEREKQHLAITFENESKAEEVRDLEARSMMSSDPRKRKSGEEQIGSHLAPLSHVEALRRVEGQYRSNNGPVSQWDRINTHIEQLPSEIQQRPAIFQFDSLQHLTEAITTMHSQITHNMHAVNALLVRKDMHYKQVKQELTSQIVERRKREEEVINWSYILKYLLASASKLRKELHKEKKANSHMTTPISLRTHGVDLSEDNLQQVGRERSSTLESVPPPPPPTLPESGGKASNIAPNSTAIRVTGPRNTQRGVAHEYLDALDRVKIRAQEAEREVKAGSQSHNFTTPSTKLFQPVTDQLGDDDQAEDEDMDMRNMGDDSEYSITSTTRSFRSAATPNSIPMPRYRPSQSKAARLRTAGIDPVTGVAATAEENEAMLKKSKRKAKKQRAPSVFAQEVAKGLGVEGSQAMTAMTVIDQISQITPEQLAQLDVQTREEILSIRRELGLDEYVPSVASRKMSAEELHIQRARSISASSRLQSRSRPGGQLEDSEGVRSSTPISTLSRDRSVGSLSLSQQQQQQSSQGYNRYNSPNKSRNFVQQPQAKGGWKLMQQQPTVATQAVPQQRQRPAQQSRQQYYGEDDEYSQLDFDV